MGEDMLITVCVGSQASFDYWCENILGVPSWKAEADWQAVHIETKDDISKLFGLPAPLALVIFEDEETPEDIKSYVTAVVDQENWIASLKETFNGPS